YCRTPFLRRNIGYRLGECPAVTAKIFSAIDPFSKRHVGERLDDSSAKLRRRLEMAIDVLYVHNHVLVHFIGAWRSERPTGRTDHDGRFTHQELGMADSAIPRGSQTFREPEGAA